MEIETTQTNVVWQATISQINQYGSVSEPRGKKIKEILGYQSIINMKEPIVTVKSRNLNYKFAFGEAHWIVSGSNRLSDITKYMKKYSDYSDDGVFLNGAYGVKFVDQLRYIVDTLEADLESRQAVVNIWRENPRGSKDIPCTLNHQYIIRNGYLNLIANMRSQDMIWGFCYDSFTFTMMAKAVQTLLRMRGIDVEMGYLYLNQGSAHIYEPFWNKVEEWRKDDEVDDFVWYDPKFGDYESFLNYLEERAMGYGTQS